MFLREPLALTFSQICCKWNQPSWDFHTLIGIIGFIPCFSFTPIHHHRQNLWSRVLELEVGGGQLQTSLRVTPTLRAENSLEEWHLKVFSACLCYFMSWGEGGQGLSILSAARTRQSLPFTPGAEGGRREAPLLDCTHRGLSLSNSTEALLLPDRKLSDWELGREGARCSCLQQIGVESPPQCAGIREDG